MFVLFCLLLDYVSTSMSVCVDLQCLLRTKEANPLPQEHTIFIGTHIDSSIPLVQSKSRGSHGVVKVGQRKVKTSRGVQTRS